MESWQNIKNTTGRKPNDAKSWLEHWSKNSYGTSKVCAHVGCNRTDVVGAHVKESGSSDNHWYIVPLCRGHNHPSVTTLDLDGRRVAVAVR